jgi:tetratricopeptide (TPR) repeat protein
LRKTTSLNNEGDLAIGAYKQVIAAGKSEYAAESQYHITEIQLQQNKYADAEKSAFEVIKKFGSYDYWVTKSYVMLGDIYLAQKDLFNAEATYKSMVENATIAELKEEAQRKLNKVMEEKNKTNKVEQYMNYLQKTVFIAVVAVFAVGSVQAQKKKKTVKAKTNVETCR